MADKELRRMNRPELIEIIYALQQNEMTLREENQRLRSELDDKLVRIEKAGSIAEAALSLSHIFEDAQRAVEIYTESLRYAVEGENGTSVDVSAQAQVENSEEDRPNVQAEQPVQPEQIVQSEETVQVNPEAEQEQASQILKEARDTADLIYNRANKRANNLLRQAKMKAEQIVSAAEESASQTRQEATEEAVALLEHANSIADGINRDREQFLLDVDRIYHEHPDLASRIREELNRGNT